MKAFSHSLSRGLAVVALGLPLLWLTACGTLSVNTVLDSQLQEIVGDLNLDVVVVRVINQTGSNMDLDLLIDDLPQKISCTALQAICDFPLPACPQQIKAVQQRIFDAQGRFIGGLNFDGVENFTFNAGEFECGGIIIFRFGDREAEAFAL